MTDDPIPRNISVTLRLLRELSDSSLRRMAEELNETPGRRIAGKKREQTAKFDHDLIEAIENQERIKIWHLGRYANWYGMPVGAILLFSQLASHLRDGDPVDIELTKSVAEAVKQVCEYAIEHADRLAIGTPAGASSSAPKDKKLTALVRKCAYKSASEEQKQTDACQVLAVNELLNQYPLESRKLYRDHSGKRFGKEPTDESQA